jgi:hypothetical protein
MNTRASGRAATTTTARIKKVFRQETGSIGVYQEDALGEDPYVVKSTGAACRGGAAILAVV